MYVSETNRLREQERENTVLKMVVAESAANVCAWSGAGTACRWT
jgi:hypothetical protein